MMNRLLPSIILAAAVIPAAAFAANSKRLDQQLRKLDPQTRLEQICDIEAMRQIKRDSNPFKPDRAVLAATADPKTSGNTIHGTGGAFRSKGKWYGFTYKCEADSDRMKVLSFEYTLGEAIPEDQWAKAGLWE
jgi:hypothetical protein